MEEDINSTISYSKEKDIRKREQARRKVPPFQQKKPSAPPSLFHYGFVFQFSFPLFSFIKHHNREWKPNLGVYPLECKKHKATKFPS